MSFIVDSYCLVLGVVVTVGYCRVCHCTSLDPPPPPRGGGWSYCRVCLDPSLYRRIGIIVSAINDHSHRCVLQSFRKKNINLCILYRVFFVLFPKKSIVVEHIAHNTI